MSVQDEVLASGSDSFWEVDSYKRTVRRTEDGLQMCGELMKLIQERADIEREYAKRLKSWSKKWIENIEKGPEYGTNKSTLKGALEEADQLGEVHMSIRERLMNEVYTEVRDWKNEYYKKSLVGGCREAKAFEEEFKKAQKPWAKRLSKVIKCKRDYHSACKLEKNTLSHETNGSEATPEQTKKQQEKLDKCRKDVEQTKSKYQDALAELNSCKSQYVSDMTDAYERTQAFEETRLKFFKQVLYHLHSSLDISNNGTIPQIYTNFRQTIDQSDPSKDLKWWSQFRGVDMGMIWPEFEEYSADGQATNKEKSKDVSILAASVTNGTNVKYNQTGAKLSEKQAVAAAEGENPFGDEEWEDDYYNSAPTHNDDDDELNSGEGVKVRALYDYAGQESDELSFKSGDVFIKLRDRDDQGWCTGRKDGKVGLYPDSYAKPI